MAFRPIGALEEKNEINSWIKILTKREMNKLINEKITFYLFQKH